MNICIEYVFNLLINDKFIGISALLIWMKILVGFDIDCDILFECFSMGTNI